VWPTLTPSNLAFEFPASPGGAFMMQAPDPDEYSHVLLAAHPVTTNGSDSMAICSCFFSVPRRREAKALPGGNTGQFACYTSPWIWQG